MAYLGITIDKNKGATMRLIDYLKKEGISQAAFAKKIKLSPAGVCRIIKGNRFPKPKTIATIDFWTRGEVTYEDFLKEAQANQQSDVSKV
jgi:transcriptional regulator with XRE-family HTH domain